MVSDQSKLCAITNNSGKDIVVAMAVNDDETSSQNAVLSANQQIEILKTSAGNIIIKSGGFDTVTLEHNYKSGSDETGYVQDYNLIVSESNWLYPLADLPAVQQGTNGSASYAPQTVDATKQAAMSQAFGFYQTIAAYPSSQLTKDYMTTLQQAQDAALAGANGSTDSAKAAAEAIENVMGSFFKGTDQFKDVTLANVVAVDNYYKNFPFVWSQYKDSLTYYLYGSDGTTAVFAGTLSLNKSGAVDITKPNGGYTCSFAPAVNPSNTASTNVDSSRVVNLTYNDGLFLDEIGASTPKIGLKGSFLLERLFTNDPDDNNVISVLTGTVNGMTCIGFDKPQTAQTSQQKTNKTAVASSSAEQYWNTLIHPKNQQDLIISLLTLVGAIMVIPATAFAVYGIYRIVRYKQQVKEMLTKQIVEYKLSELTQEQQDRMDLQFGEMCGPNKDIMVIKNFNNIEGYNKVLQNDAKSIKLIEAFELQAECMMTIMKFSTVIDQSIILDAQRTLKSVHDSITNLSTARRNDLETVLQREFNNFSNSQKDVQIIDTKVHLKISEKARQVMDDNIIDSSRILDQIRNSTEKDKEDESQTDPDLEDWIVLPEETFIK